VDVADVTKVVAAALRTGAAANAREPAPALTAAMRSLRDALARSLGGEPGAVGDPVATEEPSAIDVGAVESTAWYEWLSVRLPVVPDADLRELLSRGYAVLALADPAGMASGRYQVAGVTVKRAVLGRATSPAVDPVRLLVRSGTSAQTGPPDAATEVRHREQAMAECERRLGADHPDTLTARADLGLAYARAGRTDEATELLRRVAADRERLLGADHPDTLAARAHLALAHFSPGQTAIVEALLRQSLADRERLLGADHPDTLAARIDLARAYRSAGRTAEAVGLVRQVLADRERLLGPEHPDTVAARAMLREWRDG
jgi:tetratricopeptide (TPR) repeat protein